MSDIVEPPADGTYNTQEAMRHYFTTLTAEEIEQVESTVKEGHHNIDKVLIPFMAKLSGNIKRIDADIDRLKELKSKWQSVFENCFNSEFRYNQRKVIKQHLKKSDGRNTVRMFLKDKLLDLIDKEKTRRTGATAAITPLSFGGDAAMGST
mmetsp:Transcript_102883/g.320578  ORF Transcript_102883/g.320578 Transcript_102883/m.320578 type:complete len:151 (-) Transcript_102883:332-784(-)|eukprot:CAMPEP_0204604212 /NCGR_PEP_ID=MMETSP0661-20131031/57721_1 /ASSEMBLY_ACC=CAM_ASM_000606 /TAXON_ID=109239 /ORGANISM="Alexandrium margalefi, Strain AMGDE01CS-322" /LENGTH=150 /DNA_ID=CAMNT_0051615347 /DNA_START=52 /DNA_END=504 /DNA_ORIENTATION=-